jgi:hypothetical protein
MTKNGAVRVHHAAFRYPIIGCRNAETPHQSDVRHVPIVLIRICGVAPFGDTGSAVRS